MTHKTLENRLLKYLITNNYKLIKLLKKDYPAYSQEIETYIRIWEMSGKLPQHKKRLDHEKAWEIICKECEI